MTRNTSPPLELTDNDSIFYASETKSSNWSTTRKRFSDIKIASTSSGSKTLSSASKSISRSSVRRKLFPEDGLSRGSTAKRHCKKDIDEDTDSAKGYLKAITTSSYSGLKYKANSSKNSQLSNTQISSSSTKRTTSNTEKKSKSSSLCSECNIITNNLCDCCDKIYVCIDCNKKRGVKNCFLCSRCDIHTQVPKDSLISNIHRKKNI